MALLTTIALGSACERGWDPGQDDPVCGFSCPPGEVRTCTDVCVTPVPLGEHCTQFECLQNSVCVPGTSCVYTGEWSCQPPPAGKVAGMACDPEALFDDFCEVDAFCREDRTGNPSDPGCYPDGGFDGICSHGRKQGVSCDSNWNLPNCSPCVIGSECAQGGLGSFCHRRCETADDCPCDTDDPLSCIGGLCYPCRSFGQACDDEVRCCDADTMCGKGGVCCSTAVNTPCASPADCCSTVGLTCLGGEGTCKPCLELGAGGCTLDSDCCGSGECRDGICATPCVVDAKCDTGKPGVCAEGTVTECDPVEGATCTQNVEQSPEQCDGLDNDCDGEVDEAEDLPPTACEEPIVPGCFVVKEGFRAPGLRVCVDGGWKCDIEDRFCGWGQGAVGCGGVTLDGEYCGQCSGQPCSYPVQLCTPNQFCDGPPGTITCKDPVNECPCPGCQDWDCWLPADVGSCGEPL